MSWFRRKPRTSPNPMKLSDGRSVQDFLDELHAAAKAHMRTDPQLYGLLADAEALLEQHISIIERLTQFGRQLQDVDFCGVRYEHAPSADTDGVYGAAMAVLRLAQYCGQQRRP